MSENFSSASSKSGKAFARVTIKVGTEEASPWYIVDSGIDNISVDLIPSGGNAVVETTNNIRKVQHPNETNFDGEDLEAIVPIAWTQGSVSVATGGGLPFPVGAFRIRSLAGATAVAHVLGLNR